MPTRAEDEMEQVAQEGYDFPTNIREILKRAFEAIAKQGVEEKGEEEEEINHEEYVLESVLASVLVFDHVFSCVHATLQPAPSVGWSVTLSFFVLFLVVLGRLELF